MPSGLAPPSCPARPSDILVFSLSSLQLRPLFSPVGCRLSSFTFLFLLFLYFVSPFFLLLLLLHLLRVDLFCTIFNNDRPRLLMVNVTHNWG